MQKENNPSDFGAAFSSSVQWGRIIMPVLFIVSIGLSTASLSIFLKNEYANLVPPWLQTWLFVGVPLAFAAVIESFSFDGIRTLSRAWVYSTWREDGFRQFGLSSILTFAIFWGLNGVTNFTAVDYAGRNVIADATPPAALDSLSATLENKAGILEGTYQLEAGQIRDQYRQTEGGYNRELESYRGSIERQITELRRRERKENTSFATAIGRLEQQLANREAEIGAKISANREAQAQALTALRQRIDGEKSQLGQSERVRMDGLIRGYEKDRGERTALQGMTWLIFLLLFLACQFGVAVIQYREDVYCRNTGKMLAPTLAQTLMGNMGALLSFVLREGVLRIVLLLAVLLRLVFRCVDYVVDYIDDGKLNGSSDITGRFDDMLSQMRGQEKEPTTFP